MATAFEVKPTVRSWEPQAPSHKSHFKFQTIKLRDGCKVRLGVAGHGPAFVLLHGYTACSDPYLPATNALPLMGFKVVLIDLPGHGGSQSLPRGAAFELTAYSRWLLNALDTLGLGQVFLAGHSLGGGIAADFAGRWPERVAHLTLLNAITSQAWDKLMESCRRQPWKGAELVRALIVDLGYTGRRQQLLNFGQLYFAAVEPILAFSGAIK